MLRATFESFESQNAPRHEQEEPGAAGARLERQLKEPPVAAEAAVAAAADDVAKGVVLVHASLHQPPHGDADRQGLS